MSSKTAIEVVMFRGLAGVSREQMLAAAKAVDSRLAALPGYVSRQLGSAEDGSFVDIVRWRDLLSAHHAAQLVQSCPQCREFFALIDSATVQMAHFEED